MAVNLGQMRAFMAVADTGGVAAAAEVLGVTRPAVTMQIKALEREIGRLLFNRAGHSLAINEAGREFHGHVARLLRVVEQTDAVLLRLRNPAHGRLRVGACAPFVMVELLAAFRDRWPGVVLTSEILNSSALCAGVESGRLDIAIGTLREPVQGLFNLPLLTQRVCAVMRHDDPLAGQSSVTLEALSDRPALLREPGSMTREIVEDALAARRIELHNPTVLGSREAVKEAAACGLGHAFVLSREVGCDNRLAVVPIDGADLKATEYLLCQPDVATLSLVREVIDVARAVFPFGDASGAPAAANTRSTSAR